MVQPSKLRSRIAAVSSIAALSLSVSAQALPSQRAEARPAFDVASVRLSQESKPHSNIPLGPGDVFEPSDGILEAKNFPLIAYLVFAYKLTDYQQEAIESSAPSWVTNERYTIEARTDNTSISKDGLRLMMQSLLAERFRLAVHVEKREVRVFALVLDRPGVLGPKLRADPTGAACSEVRTKETPANKAVETPLQDQKGGFPSICHGILGLPASAQDRYSFGAAGVSTGLIASALSSWGNLGRPVIDRTALSGTYDFVLDYTPDPRPSYATIDSGGPGFQEALRRQLGLRLESQRAPVEFLVLDHIERPDAN